MFTQIFHFFAGIVLFVAILHPDVVGQWRAQSEIAYQSIMNEYYADCDCTEALE